MKQWVYGKNVVRQLLNEKKKIYEIWIAEGNRDKELEALIKRSGVSMKVMGRKQMDAKLEGRHQGIAACIDAYKTYELEEVLQAIPEGKLPLLIMLDGLEDPHNLGAILRTADAVGADGVIIGKNRSVGLTPTVAKVSTGAIDTVKVSVVTNLTKTLQSLKTKGYWVIGADMDRSQDYRSAQYDVPIVLVRCV